MSDVYDRELSQVQGYARYRQDPRPAWDLRPEEVVVFVEKYRYFRQVRSALRWFIFTRGEAQYEVMSAPGATRLLPYSQVRKALGASDTARRDFQECDMIASRLFREGSELWVEYPTGITVDSDELLAP